MLSVSTDYTAFDELRAISFPRIFLLGLTGHWTLKKCLIVVFQMNFLCEFD